MKENAKILIGDDSILARKQLKDTLSLYLKDPIFIEATNGKEAVSKYEDVIFYTGYTLQHTPAEI